MKPKSEKSIELYQFMLSRGYPEDFCDIVTQNLNTDFTAQQMIGFLAHVRNPKPETVVDEMLAILDLRNSIMKKKDMEATQARWNQFLAEGFGNED